MPFALLRYCPTSHLRGEAWLVRVEQIEDRDRLKGELVKNLRGYRQDEVQIEKMYERVHQSMAGEVLSIANTSPQRNLFDVCHLVLVHIETIWRTADTALVQRGGAALVKQFAEQDRVGDLEIDEQKIEGEIVTVASRDLRLAVEHYEDEDNDSAKETHALHIVSDPDWPLAELQREDMTTKALNYARDLALMVVAEARKRFEKKEFDVESVLRAVRFADETVFFRSMLR